MLLSTDGEDGAGGQGRHCLYPERVVLCATCVTVMGGYQHGRSRDRGRTAWLRRVRGQEDVEKGAANVSVAVHALPMDRQLAPLVVHHLVASSALSPMMSYWDSFAPVRTCTRLPSFQTVTAAPAGCFQR